MLHVQNGKKRSLFICLHGQQSDSESEDVGKWCVYKCVNVLLFTYRKIAQCGVEGGRTIDVRAIMGTIDIMHRSRPVGATQHQVGVGFLLEQGGLVEGWGFFLEQLGIILRSYTGTFV